MLAGKRILLGVTGSIAAYQAADLIGLFKNQLASLHVIMTRSAMRFVTPTTLQAISGNRVTTTLFPESGDPFVEHIALASAADALVIAPATADIIGKLAGGLADDVLTTTALAVTAPLVIAPAMNERMWFNRAVQRNVRLLGELGAQFVPPEYGPMACGGVGWGRLARLETIVRRTSLILDECEPETTPPPEHMMEAVSVE
jgi:phosphopantothenoylcysteine decarboxylase/phosphopantothenate--cysteine ligase